MVPSVVFVGIHGNVFCLDRLSGKEVWSTALTGSSFVTLLVDGDVIFAATSGEVFCLETSTGKVLWHNKMPGQGLGLVSVATANGASNPTSAAAETQQQQQTAAAVAASTR
jgi:outer membrane protein assembly factor BamB